MRLLPDTRSEIDEPSRVTSLITELRSTGNGIIPATARIAAMRRPEASY
jgi:hypothetical protein